MTRTLRSQSGITLMEMLIVVTLISLMVGISYPSITSGIESLRLNSACDSVVAFLNVAVDRAERRQEAVEVVISRAGNFLAATSATPGFQRHVSMPAGVSIVEILPASLGSAAESRFLLLPDGGVPRIGVVLSDARGTRRSVHIDPVSGVALVDRPN